MPKSKGRRNLEELDIPEERVVIDDPALEGVAERIGFDESYHAVGDLAETVTLILPASERSSDFPLHTWIEERLLRLFGTRPLLNPRSCGG